MDDDELTVVMKEVERLIRRVEALETRVSWQEGEIKGLAGRTEELERR
jgi:uncharacterized coiled-coil protein SlyX